MAITLRDANLYKDLLLEAVPAAFAGKKALAGSEAAMLVPNLPTLDANGLRRGTGSKVQIPYFASLGELEDVADGAALTPRLLSSTQEEATYIRSGIAGEITTWAQIVAQAADPYEAIAQQFAELSMRRIDQGLIDKAATTSLSYTEIDGTGTINIDSFTKARAMWDDEDDDVVLAVVSPMVMKKIRLLKDSTNRPLFEEFRVAVNGAIQVIKTFMGIPLRVSARMTPASGTTHTTLLCKRNSLVAWYNGNEPIESDRDILSASDVQAMHLYHVEHLYQRPRQAAPGSGNTKPGVVKLLTTET